MTFTKTMINMLKANPALRQEIFNAKKAAGAIKRGLTPTPKAQKIVAELEQKEATVLNSKAYQTVFEQAVKPEARYRAVEDAYNKGYLQDEAFWQTYPKFSDLLKEIHHKPGLLPDPGRECLHPEYYEMLRNFRASEATKAYVQEMKNVRKTQGEIDSIIDRSKLKITLDSIS